MAGFSRRRFLTITAAGAVAGLAGGRAQARGLYRWRGLALGAEATIYLDHPEAERITALAAAEIARLEDIFSLYRPASALSQLNARGRLSTPPFELLECLAICRQVHAATGGLFDPTVQPLWALHAESAVAGRAPTAAEIDQRLRLVGLQRLTFSSTAVELAPGQALTLNGVAQGHIADQVTRLLQAEGLSSVLVNTGELRATGQNPLGGAWPVTLVSGGQLGLTDRALATSQPLGTVFDAAGLQGHILDPRNGRPARPFWSSVSISARLASVADALSTAACLMPDRKTIAQAVAAMPDVRIEALQVA